jgi:hypothetical protein
VTVGLFAAAGIFLFLATRPLDSARPNLERVAVLAMLMYLCAFGGVASGLAALIAFLKDRRRSHTSRSLS